MTSLPLDVRFLSAALLLGLLAMPLIAQAEQGAPIRLSMDENEVLLHESTLPAELPSPLAGRQMLSDKASKTQVPTPPQRSRMVCEHRRDASTPEWQCRAQ